MSEGGSLRRWMREPLVHFVLLGAALFGLHAVISRGSGSADDSIVITTDQIKGLAGTFESVWQRPPSPQELDGLIQERVREEVASREAISLGLDRDDTVIRHRLRQKLEFISEDSTAQPEPADAELVAFMLEHPGDYQIQPRFSFRQEVLQPAGPSALALPTRYSDSGASDLAGSFGEPFVKHLVTMPVGQWTQPVTSSFGTHKVLLEERTEGRMPDLSEVRAAVVRDWEAARRAAATDRLYQDLLRRYHVTIEKPPAP